MAQAVTDLRDEPNAPEREGDHLVRLSGVVRVALGRLGARLSPWLDEGLLMSSGLIALLEPATGELPADALLRAVAAMRASARASSWYQAALPCRIAPLCASLARAGASNPVPDRAIADDLGLALRGVAERYVEAGLVFAVSPELLLPRGALPAALAAAVGGLPVEQRRLLTLYFEDGLSFPEIGAILAISPEAAQALYGRAAALIRARIAHRSRTVEVST